MDLDYMRKAWERKKKLAVQLLIGSQYGMWDTKPIDCLIFYKSAALKLTNYGPD